MHFPTAINKINIDLNIIKLCCPISETPCLNININLKDVEKIINGCACMVQEEQLKLAIKYHKGSN